MRSGAGSAGAGYRLSGTVSDIISQTLNYQGNAASAIANNQTQEMTLDALTQRLD